MGGIGEDSMQEVTFEFEEDSAGRSGVEGFGGGAEVQGLKCTRPTHQSPR